MRAQLLAQRSFGKLVGHIVGLTALASILFQEVGEEKQFENKENDEQLYQDDGPQRLAPRHVAEAVGIQVVCPVQEARFFHRPKAEIAVVQIILCKNRKKTENSNAFFRFFLILLLKCCSTQESSLKT